MLWFESINKQKLFLKPDVVIQKERLEKIVKNNITI